MNLDNLNKWLTLAANLGVFAGILFLVLELQQNTESNMAATRHAVIESDLAILQSLIDNPSIEASIKKMSSDEEVTFEDKVRVENWLIAMARTREHQWVQYQNNMLDERTFDTFLTGLTLNISFPITRKWWDAVAYDYFDDEFVDEINRRLESVLIRDFESGMDLAIKFEN